MKKIITLFCLFLFINTTNAQIFEPHVIIDPPNPMVGDTIRVGVAHTFHSPCLTLPANNFQGLSHLFEYDENDLTLSVVNDTFIVPICNPFPITPAPRAWYELGQLAEGGYTLKTWVSDSTLPLPIPDIYDPLVYGPILSFVVVLPISIDSLSKNWILLYLFLISLITYLFKKINF